MIITYCLKYKKYLFKRKGRSYNVYFLDAINIIIEDL